MQYRTKENKRYPINHNKGGTLSPVSTFRKKFITLENLYKPYNGKEANQAITDVAIHARKQKYLYVNVESLVIIILWKQYFPCSRSSSRYFFIGMDNNFWDESLISWYMWILDCAN